MYICIDVILTRRESREAGRSIVNVPCGPQGLICPVTRSCQVESYSEAPRIVCRSRREKTKGQLQAHHRHRELHKKLSICVGLMVERLRPWKASTANVIAFDM